MKFIRWVSLQYDEHGNCIALPLPLPPKPTLTEAERRSQRGTDNFLRVLEVLTGTPQEVEPADAPEVTRYRYDGSHQLVAIEHADGARTEYEYDVLGRRVAKHHTPNGGASRTTLFQWDGDWLLQELHRETPPHAVRTRHLRAAPGPGGTAHAAGGWAGVALVTDHLGTPQELYDDAREVAWAADFSAYGCTVRRLAHEVDNPLRFPGQYYDSESGLHYNRFRYYDPEVGRYVNQDPIGLMGGANSYSYVKGNPATQIDPHGLHGRPGIPCGEANPISKSESKGSCRCKSTSRGVYGQGGIGASIHAFVAGVSVSAGAAVSTSGQMCTVRTICGRIGLGLYAGLGGSFGGGAVFGRTDSLGGMRVGSGGDLGFGASIGGQVTVGLNPDGSLSSAGAVKGKGGGYGVNVGLDACYSWVNCTKCD